MVLGVTTLRLHDRLGVQHSGDLGVHVRLDIVGHHARAVFGLSSGEAILVAAVIPMRLPGFSSPCSTLGYSHVNTVVYDFDPSVLILPVRKVERGRNQRGRIGIVSHAVQSQGECGG